MNVKLTKTDKINKPLESTISYRIAVASDLDAVVNIENNCFDTEKFNRRQLSYLMFKANGCCFVAIDGDKIVGYISLIKHTRRSNLRIYSLAVDASAQRKHIGQGFIEIAKAYAKENKLSSITLEVRLDNAPAISLYKRNGFSETEILPNYFKYNIDAFRMKVSIE